MRKSKKKVAEKDVTRDDVASLSEQTVYELIRGKPRDHLLRSGMMRG